MPLFDKLFSIKFRILYVFLEMLLHLKPCTFPQCLENRVTNRKLMALLKIHSSVFKIILIFYSAVEKCKHQNIRDYNFACGSLWV
jgi:hypothetical protein